jgi:alpha-L-rhamnosidase
MLRSLIITLITIILFITACSESKKGVSVYDLRCENLADPLGIGTTIPRLSWKISSEQNGTSQKAFQILVASDSSLLDEMNADLWNSDKILSSSGILVLYGGKELNSRSVCYWKVRIWNDNDVVTGWSESALFSVGLLTKSDWKADYIGFPSESSDKISPLLRKTFNLTEKGDKVFLYVSSLGYHEIYLNGEKIGDKVLTPAVSQFNKRSLALTYDISSMIRKGRNDIIIWIGKGWYSTGLPGVKNDGPLVKAQIEQLKEGNWNTIITTDSLWIGRNSGYSDTGTWRAHQFGGERVDGSLLLTDMSAPTLDKISWTPVSVLEDPGYEVTPQTTESNKIIETIKADTLFEIGKFTWMVDMGNTLTGWIEIEFPELQKGQEVIMEFSDHLDKDGNIVDQGQKDIYISSGGKNEKFRNRFNYHGFRYIKISNLIVPPVKDNVKALLIHTDYRLASSFKCSDADLNNIHDMILYTLRCLSLGGYLVDCPQIERLGYGGDGNASTATAQLMFDLDPLYSNWLQAWADCIRDDGGMPHTAPNPYPAGGGPYWCGFIITASWKTYQNYGDIRVLEKYYPVMQKWLAYAEKYSPTGLLKPWPDTDYRGWFLGDWAVPEGTDQTNEASVTLVNNCFIAVCFETMQKIAGVLGKTDDIERYAEKNKQIRALIHNTFFNTASKIYASGSQIDLTYPLLAGVVPDSLSSVVKENLYNEIKNNHSGHFACGLVGIPVFTEWVVKNHETDLMYSILKKRDYPGYLYMIDNGATTTWEHWNGARSRIHNCYNGIGTWFYQAVGGIMADESFPAYKHLLINPQIPEGVTWAKTTRETPYGTVGVNWIKENDLFTMNIKVPVGSTARVTLPESISGYRLNGKSIKNKDSFAEISSGEYEFLCKLK